MKLAELLQESGDKAGAAKALEGAMYVRPMDLQGHAFNASWGLTSWWPLIGPSTVLLTFSLMLVQLLGILGRDMEDKQREWWSRLGAWLLILI